MSPAALSLTLCQLAAAIAAVVLYESVSYIAAIAIVWSLGFSHYLLGLIYSRKQVSRIVVNPGTWLPFVVLLLVWTYFYFQHLPLIVIFGIHHVLNESYLSARYAEGMLNVATKRKLQLSGCVAHLSGYLLIVYTEAIFSQPVILAVLAACLVVGLGYYCRVLLGSVRSGLDSTLINALFAEILLVVAVLFDSTIYPINPYQIVFYHFFFWVLYPASRQLLAGRNSSLVVYLAATAATVVIFVGLSPIFSEDKYARIELYRYWFVLMSFVHIGLSMAISTANPAWMVSLFGGSSGVKNAARAARM